MSATPLFLNVFIFQRINGIFFFDLMLQRDVVVVGNPRVHKALKKQMEQLYKEFSRLCNASNISVETLHVLEYLAGIYIALEK